MGLGSRNSGSLGLLALYCLHVVFVQRNHAKDQAEIESELQVDRLHFLAFVLNTLMF